MFNQNKSHINNSLKANLQKHSQEIKEAQKNQNNNNRSNNHKKSILLKNNLNKRVSLEILKKKKSQENNNNRQDSLEIKYLKVHLDQIKMDLQFKEVKNEIKSKRKKNIT